jgi:hypothetical protein
MIRAQIEERVEAGVDRNEVARVEIAWQEAEVAVILVIAIVVMIINEEVMIRKKNITLEVAISQIAASIKAEGVLDVEEISISHRAVVEVVQVQRLADTIVKTISSIVMQVQMIEVRLQNIKNWIFSKFLTLFQRVNRQLKILTDAADVILQEIDIQHIQVSHLEIFLWENSNNFVQFTANGNNSSSNNASSTGATNNSTNNNNGNANPPSSVDVNANEKATAQPTNQQSTSSTNTTSTTTSSTTATSSSTNGPPPKDQRPRRGGNGNSSNNMRNKKRTISGEKPQSNEKLVNGSSS